MNKKSMQVFRSVILVVSLVMLLSLPVKAGLAAPAASIEVNTTDDEFGSAPSYCSLREAVEAVHLGTSFGGCSNPSGLTAIHVPASALYNYSLTITGANEFSNATGDINIRDNLTISGDDLSTTIISGSSIDRVFHIAPDKVVTLNNLSLINGASPSHGGAIYNAGSLTLNNVSIHNNSAQGSGGGIYSSYDGSVVASLNLNFSSVYTNTATVSGGKGGGIANDSGNINLYYSSIDHNTAYSDGGGIWSSTGYTASIDHSLVYSNASQHGSGGNIYNFGPMTIDITRIYNGSANVDGGNIYTGYPGGGGSIMIITNSDISFGSAVGSGGGIANDGILTITNTSFYNDGSSKGGALYTREPVSTTSLNHVTMSGNLAGISGGFAIYHEALATPVVVNNSILSDGFSAVCVGSVASTSSYNIDSSTSCGLPGGQYNQSSIDPGLGAFDFHGYSFTKTFSLAVTSPAVDWIPAGANGCGSTITADQRGIVRPIDGNRDGTPACDVGAFELQMNHYLPAILK